jgi:peptidyl-prolyl cis-trans isomerase B (cyclophilin B)
MQPVSIRLASAAAALMLGALVGVMNAQTPGSTVRTKPASKARARAPIATPAPVTPTPGAGPVIVVETSKGSFELETYPDDAPKTVAHVVNLVKRGFYNGLRVHRAVPNFVLQLGDPQTRDMSKREWWGRGDFSGSGTPVGVAEISKKHLHVRGAVAMAHPGNASLADAQFYIALTPQPKLDGKYAVFGRVIAGLDVLPKLQVADLIKKVYVKSAPAT